MVICRTDSSACSPSGSTKRFATHPRAANGLTRLTLTLHRRIGQKALLFEAGQCQTVASAHTGLLEDVLQMDLHGARTDPHEFGDLFVFQSLLHQFDDLVLA